MTKEPSDNSRIKRLEEEIKSKESIIKSLKERLDSNQKILEDVIREKNLLNNQIREYELKQMDSKFSRYQEMEEEHQKAVHRLEVTKNHLDLAKAEIKSLEKIIEDLKNRGLVDYLLGRFPDSFKEYKEEE